MKKFFLGIGCLLALAISVISHSESTKDTPLTSGGLVGEVLNTAANEIERKYHLSVCGTGVAMPGGPIRELCLAFQIQGELSKDRVRELLIACAQEIVYAVQKNKDIQPFLFYPDFDIRHVEVIFYISGINGSDIYDPAIGVADISNGRLTYRTYDEHDQPHYKNRFHESYEEALQVLEASAKIN